MTHRRRSIAAIAAALLAAAAPCAPALADASGGASAPSGGAPTAPAPVAATPTSPPPAAAETAPGASGGAALGGPTGSVGIGTPVARSSATAGGITLEARAVALLRQRTVVTGTAPARLGEVAIQQLDAEDGWQLVATAAIGEDGAFSAAWRPRRAGAQQLRAVPATAASRATADAPQVDVTIHRTSVASWYGPGFFGRTTACGIKLRRTTLGVAHKTLPCGTQVQLVHGDTTITVPVIDRGPFHRGRTWDLTQAAHDAFDTDAGLLALGAVALTDQPRIATPLRAPAIRR